MKGSEEKRHPLLVATINELERGIDMIAAIDDRTYRTATNRTGSIGGHFRHNLDFVTSLLNGISKRRVDYNRRERSPRLETDRLFAIDAIELAIGGLKVLTDEILGRLVHVRSEIDADGWLTSSILRELEFVHSHTVHHHALIGEKLVGFGIKTSENFGVARSTLEYWKRIAEPGAPNSEFR